MPARAVVVPRWRTMGSRSLIRRARKELARARDRRPGGRWSGRDKAIFPSATEAMRSRAEEVVASPRVRIACVSAVFLLAASVIVWRATELQIFSGARYEEVAEKQARVMARIKAKRGVIRDRHGAELAITVDVDSVYAEPRRIDDPEAAEKIANALSMRESDVRKKLESDRAFVYIRRRVDANRAARVRALGLRGVGTRPEPKRFYSNMSLAAHAVGFTNLDGQGVAGIERAMNVDLEGKSYDLVGLRDGLGQKVLQEGFIPTSIMEGSDVELTIDRQIQHATDESLAEAVRKHSARAGVALVLEVDTGDVLALSSFPTFNPNNLAKSRPEQHLNRAVSAVYEPGSTMKIVTIAGALEDGVITLNSRVDCENGQFRLGRRTIRDADHAYGELSISEIMKVSSNICAAKLGLRLGPERLYGWLKSFGFGAPTGVELPAEIPGLVRPAERWREIDLANVAFGQGVSVTPLQIAQAAAVVASKGLRRPPRLVRSIADKRGGLRVFERPAAVRVLSERTAMDLTKMMSEVTREGGTAELAAIPGFDVAGKTGTAQKIDPVTRSYSRKLHVASFVGFVPAQDPDVVVLVLLDEPEGAYFGGVVAAPAFQRIAMAALSAREIFPEDPVAREAFLDRHRTAQADDDEGPGRAGVERGRDVLRADAADRIGQDRIGQDRIGQDRDGQDGELEEKWFQSNGLSNPGAAPSEVELVSGLSAEARTMLGEATSSQAEPEVGQGLEGGPDDATAAVARPSSRGVPNFLGLGPREVIERSAEVRCDPLLLGWGRAVDQDPKPGTAIEPGATCRITMAPAQGPRMGRRLRSEE